MVRVFRWDGKERFVNPDLIAIVELSADESQTEITMINGQQYSLSRTSYDILTGATIKKTGPGKAGFDVL